MNGWVGPRPVGPPPAEVLELEPDCPIALADGEALLELLEAEPADRLFMLQR